MKKAKIGIIGLGKLGLHHAHNIEFKIPNAKIVAGCSINQEEVDYIKNNWDIPFGYLNYMELLKHEELDGIVIASSASVHHEQVIAALEAGFHIWVEKPLSLSLDEINEIERVYEQHKNQIFQLGFMRRFDPSYAYAKKSIEEGSIGEPIIVKCNGLDPLSSKDKLIPYSPTSGGMFLDMSIHDIDLARWYLNAEAKNVFALGGVYVIEELKDLNDIDNAAMMIEFENGKMGLFHTSRTATHGYHIETQVFGTEGSLVISNVPEKNLVTFFDKHGARRDCYQWFIERFHEAYLLELQEFVDCILENRKPSVSLIDGKMSTKIAYAAQESLEKKQVVQL